MSRLIVKNLPDQITKDKLYQIFSEKGVVTDVQLKFTKNGVFRRFAFIGFQKPEFAEAAKAALNRSYINMSRIEIENCAELGDPNKPRPWSRYAPENVVKKKRKQEKSVDRNDDNKKKKRAQKEKIKDPKVKELLKSHVNDELFKEFMEIHVPIESFGEDKLNQNKKEDIEEETNEENDEENEDNLASALANHDIPDCEYIKLKTGQNITITSNEDTENTDLKKNEKKKIDIELFTIKLKGLPLGVKKSQIREFLKPLKAFTIRRALKVKGVAYCGFKTEKEARQAYLKNRSFLGGRRIFVTMVRKKVIVFNEETEHKWRIQSERLNGLETVAESGRIFVRNLPYTVTEEELHECFSKYGPISELILPIDSFTRKPKGFAIITYLIPENAWQAFNKLDGTIFSGRMLHLLPAFPNNDETESTNNEGLSFKQKKSQNERKKVNCSSNWNTFFIGENALAETVASAYNTTKEKVLDDKTSGAAVRLALGETELVNKIKQFLEENDVCLEAFENMSSTTSRSKTVILVKNMPFGTKSEELREKFSKFGLLKRVVLPLSGVAGLVEFVEPSEAKLAFKRLAYSKFKHVPLYLEWAPHKVFKKDFVAKENTSFEDKEDKNIISKTSVKSDLKAKTESELSQTNSIHQPDGAIIFVKNLNFVTEEAALWKHFEDCGSIKSVTISRKKDPQEPTKTLSMGFGFVEFFNKESADKALKTLQFTNLDSHKIELKRSNRTTASEIMPLRKVSKRYEKPSTKILVRNVPFQAVKKEIHDLFKVFGEIKAVRLPQKMVGTGSHRGFCFVEYNTVEAAKRAFAALSQSTHLYGRRLVLEWASADDDIDALREKTAQQFKSGHPVAMQKKKIVMDDNEK